MLAGRLYENLGRKEDALTSYRAAAASQDRRSAAQGRLREIELLNETGDMPRQEVIHELETLTTTWRGDETESGGLRLLAHLYTGDNRYRDAFHVMRTALRAHPDSDQTRKIQDEAAATFDSLFLAGKGDTLPPVEALGLFYDFRELTPIGRRGDEMIRRLADRLVSVDLLDQAAELLQHQVDHRLNGAARAQVATRLAVVYLMNRKPDRALATLQKTRTADLSNELRDQRLLLEARAISDGGRHELALEVIAGIKGREAIRLRSDIMWSAKRWRDAAEQIELMYGARWKEFTPLTDAERTDILRAAIGYALSDEQISLERLREKYAVKFADGPERRAFDVVSTPIGAAGPEFQDIANRLAATDTLEGFLRDLRARYPDAATPAADLTKESAKEPPRELAKDPPRIAATQAPKDGGKGAAKDVPLGASKDAPPVFPVAAPSPIQTAAATGASGGLQGSLMIVTDQFATVTVVPGAEIRRNGAATLGDLLFDRPGITGSGFAPGASSRPIIRGLDVNRVRIQEDGTGANGASDLGEDHFVPVDPLTTDHVEVIRGPATLRFGSQAIGGVVETTNNRVPTFIPQRGVSTEFRGAATSVDNGLNGAVLLDAGANNFAMHADAFGRTAQDYRAPRYPYLIAPDPVAMPNAMPPGAFNGRQPNSNLHTGGQSVGGSYIFNEGFFGLAVTQNNALYHIPGSDGENRPRF